MIPAAATTPAWKPIVEALANLRPGGRLVVNAIRKDLTADLQRRASEALKASIVYGLEHRKEALDHVLLFGPLVLIWLDLGFHETANI